MICILQLVFLGLQLALGQVASSRVMNNHTKVILSKAIAVKHTVLLGSRSTNFGKRNSMARSIVTSAKKNKDHYDVPSQSEATHSTTSIKTAPGNRKKVAVIGSGAVGSYYGARLWEVGHDVHFYMRNPDHIQACRRKGMSIQSEQGDVQIPAEEIQLHSNTETIGPSDWIIVALKSTSLEVIPSLVAPLLHRESRIAAIMNGMIDDALVQLFKNEFGESPCPHQPLQCCSTLYGCMAFIASNRVEPGVIHHVGAKGALSAGVASTQDDEPGQAMTAFQDLWSRSKVPITFEKSLLRGRWEKMMWNLPFSGISVAMGGITTDLIIGDPDLRELAERIMFETIQIANADLARFHGKDGFVPLGEKEMESLLSITETLGPYKTSTMLDLVNRRSMEVKYLFRDPFERANRLGVHSPHLHTIVNQISFYQRLHGLY